MTDPSPHTLTYVPEARQCTHILNGGERCQAYAMRDAFYCFSHNPSTREAKVSSSQRGGLASQSQIAGPLALVKITKPEDVIKLLSITIDELRSNKITPKIASTIGFLAGHLLQAFEVTGLDRRLEEFEAVINQRGRKAGMKR